MIALGQVWKFLIIHNFLDKDRIEKFWPNFVGSKLTAMWYFKPADAGVMNITVE